MKSITLKDTLSYLSKGIVSFISIGRWLIHYLCTFFLIYLAPQLYKLFTNPNWKDLWFLYRIYAKISLWGFGVKLVIEDQSGIKENEQFIMVANHRSWLDQVSLLIAMKQQPHFFTKDAYLKIPILGKALSNHEAIPVEHKSLRTDTSEIVKGFIKKGDNLLLFLEGTRGHGRNLLPFRFGAVKYSSDYNLPLLPIYILGSEEVLSKKRSLLEINPGEIKIIIDRPIILKNLDLEKEKEEFENNYRKKYHILYDQFHSKKGIKKND